MYLLPYIIKPTLVATKRSVDRKVTKKRTSTQECREAFFLHVQVTVRIFHWQSFLKKPGNQFLFQNLDEITKKLEGRKEYCKNVGRTFQPTPLFVGPSLLNTESSFLIIDETLYTVVSVPEAFQLTFKIFYALNAEYPVEARQIWLFF